MKTGLALANPANNISPLSTILLVLAVFLAVAAWRMLDINRDLVPPRPSPEVVSKAPSQIDWNNREAYQAHRHQAVPVDDGSGARNRDQQTRTELDEPGFLIIPDSGGWNWGLETKSLWYCRAETGSR